MSADRKTPCIDGGTMHAWRRTGLDVRMRKGEQVLVWTKVCTWCTKERTRRYRGWRRGPNGKAIT